MNSVGIAQVDRRVAYRLDCAEKIPVATRDNKGEIQLREARLPETDSIRCIQQISRLGIRTLICGAVSGFACRMLQHHGIQVIGWVVGDAQEVLEHYLKGDLHEGEILCASAGKRWKRSCSGRRTRGRKMTRIQGPKKGEGNGKG